VIAHPLIDPAKPEPTGLPLLFSPETSPQLVDFPSWRSHQTPTVAPAALRSRQISAASALSAFDFPAASPHLPPCLRASASKSSAPLTRPSPQVSQHIPPRRLRRKSSPETSPQLVDCSSMHRSVAFQAAMTPFVGAFFSGFLAHSTTAPPVALSSAPISASLRVGVRVVGPGMSLFLRKTS
jgi:hypothetical protein